MTNRVVKYTLESVISQVAPVRELETDFIEEVKVGATNVDALMVMKVIKTLRAVIVVVDFTKKPETIKYSRIAYHYVFHYDKFSILLVGCPNHLGIYSPSS